MCRHFPTKQALVGAVLTAMYQSLLADAEAALEQPDAGAGFEAFFLALSNFHAAAPRLAEQMATDVGLPTAEEPLRQSLHQAIAALVARAQASGTIRDDIGPADVKMLISGAAHAASIVGDLEPMLRERYARIILDGLQPMHPTPLPGRPLDLAQLRRLKQRRRS